MFLKIPYRQLILFLIIAMMLSSALISYFMVRRNEPKITLVKMEILNKQNLIKNIWNNISRKENNASTVLIASLLDNQKAPDAFKIKDYYLAQFPNLNNKSKVADILQAVENEKKSDLDYIDELYSEQAALENQILEIESSSRLYSDIAFFLQTLSVIIILIRKDMVEES